MIHTFTHSLTHTLTHSLTHSRTHLLTHSQTNSLTHSLTHSHTHTLNSSLTYTLTHAHTHKLTQSHTNTHSTHSLTYSLTHTPTLTYTLTYSLTHSLVPRFFLFRFFGTLWVNTRLFSVFKFMVFNSEENQIVWKNESMCISACSGNDNHDWPVLVQLSNENSFLSFLITGKLPKLALWNGQLLSVDMWTAEHWTRTK